MVTSTDTINKWKIKMSVGRLCLVVCYTQAQRVLVQWDFNLFKLNNYDVPRPDTHIVSVEGIAKHRK